jgi:hypothetical protein
MQLKIEVRPNPPTAIFNCFAPKSKEVSFTRCITSPTLPGLRHELRRKLRIEWSGDLETALNSGLIVMGETKVADEMTAAYLAI